MKHQPGPDQLVLVAPDRGANAARRRALSRRTFLGVSLGAVGAVGLGGQQIATARTTRIEQDPFRLGIASGDPTATGIVLWTRLAVDALAEDGLGGMPSTDIEVQWQLSHHPRFRQVLRSGTVVARPESSHAVHIELEDLPSGREFFYRFKVGGHVSEVGRALTMPEPGDSRPLNLVALSCTHYEGGYFTAYQHAAEEQPDLVFALGD